MESGAPRIVLPPLLSSPSTAINALSFDKACLLSAMRGRAMAVAGRTYRGGMAAVHGSERRLAEVLEFGASAGAIFAAGQTTAETYLVSGERAALRAAASMEDVSTLPVSGPWHSPLMGEAVAELRPLAESIIEDACGTTARVSNETAERGPRDALRTIELVLGQLTRPMRLHEGLELLLSEGVSDVVVLGPHRALRHILNRHLEDHPTVQVHGSATIEDLRTVVRKLT